MPEITIKIEGMSCQHCVARVKKAIDALSGIEQSDILVGSATVKYDEAKINKEEIETAVENAGYKISR